MPVTQRNDGCIMSTIIFEILLRGAGISLLCYTIWLSLSFGTITVRDAPKRGRELDTVMYPVQFGALLLERIVDYRDRPHK
jgi:hypothetical protein